MISVEYRPIVKSQKSDEEFSTEQMSNREVFIFNIFLKCAFHSAYTHVYMYVRIEVFSGRPGLSLDDETEGT